MKGATKPINPEILGVIGDMQWRFLLRQEGADVGPLRSNIDQRTYRYIKTIDSYRIGDSTIPYVIEAGFAVKLKLNSREFRSGLNWSPSLGKLFLNEANKAMNDVGCRADDPVSVILHVVTPVVNFTDRGKSNVAMHPVLNAAVLTPCNALSDHGQKPHEIRKNEQ